MILFILSILGALSVGRWMYKLIVTLWRIRTQRNDLTKVYGIGAWAVITGGTDGIGFGFCEELACKGFNICIISRSKQKLEKKIEQLRASISDKVQYKAIVTDFTNPDFQILFTELSTLDIGILINNVGISQLTYLRDQSYTSMKDIINVNINAQTLLTAHVLKNQSVEKHRLGIVNISSYSGVKPLPYMSVYAATKAYNDVFSRSLAKEYLGSQVDVLSVPAMKVISGKVKEQKSLTVCTSRECASESLKWLGKTDQIPGHFKHNLMALLIQILPAPILDYISIKEAKKNFLQYRKQS